MSKTFDIHKRAQELRSEHQKNIDNILQQEIEKLEINFESFAKQKVNIFKQSLEDLIEQQEQTILINLRLKTEQILTEITNRQPIWDQQLERKEESIFTQINQLDESLSQDLKESKDLIERKKTAITANLSKAGENLQKEIKEMNSELQTQITAMKKDLQKLSGLNREVVSQAKLKKVLFSSNLILISVLIILLIAIIAVGYVSKNKYNEITMIKQQQQLEQAKLSEIQNALTLSKDQFFKKYPTMREN